MEYSHHATTCKRTYSSSRSVRHVCTCMDKRRKMSKCTRAGLNLLCLSPATPSRVPNNVTGLALGSSERKGSPGKLPTTTHARNETGRRPTRATRGSSNHLDHWHSETPNPQQHPPSLVLLTNPTTMISKMPCICTSTHTFSLRSSDPIASVPNRPAGCQAPTPSPVLTTWFTSRSASRNIPSQTTTLPYNPFPVRCFPTPPWRDISSAVSVTFLFHRRKDRPFASFEDKVIVLPPESLFWLPSIVGPPVATCRRLPGSRPRLAYHSVPSNWDGC